MSTATVETQDGASTSRRSPAGNSRSRDRSRQQLQASSWSTEAAMSELVRGSLNATTAVLPGVLVHPTQAVECFYDLVEQALAASRRLATELAMIVESGLEGAERQAA